MPNVYSTGWYFFFSLFHINVTHHIGFCLNIIFCLTQLPQQTGHYSFPWNIRGRIPGFFAIVFSLKSVISYPQNKKVLSYFSSMSNLLVTIFPLYVKTVSAMFIPAILIKNLLFFYRTIFKFHKCCLMFLILVHILGFYRPSLFLHKNQNIASHASNLIITRRPDLK